MGCRLCSRLRFVDEPEVCGACQFAAASRLTFLLWLGALIR